MLSSVFGDYEKIGGNIYENIVDADLSLYADADGNWMVCISVATINAVY